MRGRSTAIRVAGLLVSLAALAFLVRTVDLDATRAVLARVDLVPLVAVAVVLAIQLLLRAVRWRLLVPVDAGRARPPVSHFALVLPIGYLANAILPARLGEPVRAYVLARREGLDAATVFGAVVLERVVDTATLAAVAFGAALLVGGPGWLTGGIALVAVACAAGLIAMALATVLGRVRPKGLIAVAAERIVGAWRSRLEAFVRGFSATRDVRVLLAAASISVACWFLDASLFWLCGQALGIGLSAPAAVLIAAVTVLGTAIPSAPGYVGTFELAAAGIGGLVGVPAASALALALLAHAVAVLPVAIVGAVVLALTGGDLGEVARQAELAR